MKIWQKVAVPKAPFVCSGCNCEKVSRTRYISGEFFTVENGVPVEGPVKNHEKSTVVLFSGVRVWVSSTVFCPSNDEKEYCNACHSNACNATRGYAPGQNAGNTKKAPEEYRGNRYVREGWGDHVSPGYVANNYKPR